MSGPVAFVPTAAIIVLTSISTEHPRLIRFTPPFVKNSTLGNKTVSRIAVSAVRFDPDLPHAATVRAWAEYLQVEIQFDLEDLSVGESRTLRISEVGRCNQIRLSS